MDKYSSCIESDNSLNSQKDGIDPIFPFIDIKIKEEEIDLGEDSIEATDEDADSLILCPECAYITHSESLFLLHCKHHQDSDKKILTCAECEYVTTYRGDLNIHITKEHPPDEKLFIHQAPDLKIKSEATESNLEETPKFGCGNCEFITSCKRSLCRHLMLNPRHTLKEVFTCGGKCLFKTKCRLNLNRHLQRDHPRFFKDVMLGVQLNNKEDPEIDNTKYKCSQCKFWGERRSLRLHVIKEHPQFLQTR